MTNSKFLTILVSSESGTQANTSMSLPPKKVAPVRYLRASTMSSTSLDSSTSSYFSMICLMLKIDLFLVPFLGNDAISISFLDFGFFVAFSTGIGITTSLCCFGTGLSFFPFGGRGPKHSLHKGKHSGNPFSWFWYCSFSLFE